MENNLLDFTIWWDVLWIPYPQSIHISESGCWKIMIFHIYPNGFSITAFPNDPLNFVSNLVLATSICGGFPPEPFIKTM